MATEYIYNNEAITSNEKEAFFSMVVDWTFAVSLERVFQLQ